MSKPFQQPRRAVVYARVSSKEQEKEGFSIPAQLKSLNSYARENSLQVEKEFIDVETAKRSGRTGFSEMMSFLKMMVVDQRTIWGYRSWPAQDTLCRLYRPWGKLAPWRWFFQWQCCFPVVLTS